MQIKPGKYKHFKGHLCNVIGIAKHSETLEEFVVYIHPDPIKDEEENSMWIRPKSMFLDTVEKDGKQIPRFEFIED